MHHPVDYAHVVKAIGNEMDLTVVNLEGILPSATIMVVSVTATTTSGRPLSEDNLKKTLQACDLALKLDADKKMVSSLCLFPPRTRICDPVCSFDLHCVRLQVCFCVLVIAAVELHPIDSMYNEGFLAATGYVAPSP